MRFSALTVCAMLCYYYVEQRTDESRHVCCTHKYHLCFCFRLHTRPDAVDGDDDVSRTTQIRVQSGIECVAREHTHIYTQSLTLATLERNETAIGRTVPKANLMCEPNGDECTREIV